MLIKVSIFLSTDQKIAYYAFEKCPLFHHFLANNVTLLLYQII